MLIILLSVFKLSKKKFLTHWLLECEIWTRLEMKNDIFIRINLLF
jgi:hypothetical protein